MNLRRSSPPFSLTRVRIFWAVSKRRERPEGVSWETDRTGELCHDDAVEVRVFVRDLRSDAIVPCKNVGSST